MKRKLSNQTIKAMAIGMAVTMGSSILTNGVNVYAQTEKNLVEKQSLVSSKLETRDIINVTEGSTKYTFRVYDKYSNPNEGTVLLIGINSDITEKDGKQTVTGKLTSGKVSANGETFKILKIGDGNTNLSGKDLTTPVNINASDLSKVITNDLAEVGNYAFKNANINGDLTLSARIISANAFEGASILGNLTLDTSSINTGTFKNANLQTVTLTNVTQVNTNAFENAVIRDTLNLTGVQEVYTNAFKNADVNTIVLGSSLRKINQNAFNLKSGINATIVFEQYESSMKDSIVNGIGGSQANITIQLPTGTTETDINELKQAFSGKSNIKVTNKVNEAPTIKDIVNVKEGDNKITLNISEVLQACNQTNNSEFTLIKKSGDTVKIPSYEVSKEGNSIVLNLQNSIQAGEYTLKFAGNVKQLQDKQGAQLVSKEINFTVASKSTTTESTTESTTETTTSKPSNNVPGGGANIGTSSGGGNIVVTETVTSKEPTTEVTTEITTEYVTEGTTDSNIQTQHKDLSLDIVFLPNIEGESKSFNDVNDSSWAKPYIDKLSTAGIISGSSDGQFNPNGQTKRADVAVMLVKLLGLTPETNDKFKDVNSNAYYAPYVGAASSYGIINGSNGMFNPESVISRQDTMVMMAQVLKGLNLNINTDTQNLAQFTDVNNISDYAQESVAILVNSNIISGNDGKLNPTKPVTRAEMTAIMSKVYDLIDSAK